MDFTRIELILMKNALKSFFNYVGFNMRAGFSDTIYQISIIETIKGSSTYAFLQSPPGC